MQASVMRLPESRLCPNLTSARQVLRHNHVNGGSHPPGDARQPSPPETAPKDPGHSRGRGPFMSDAAQETLALRLPSSLSRSGSAMVATTVPQRLGGHLSPPGPVIRVVNPRENPQTKLRRAFSTLCVVRPGGGPRSRDN